MTLEFFLSYKHFQVSGLVTLKERAITPSASQRDALGIYLLFSLLFSFYD